MKIMDAPTHRAVHAKKKGFNHAGKLWHGSNELKKSVAGAAVGKATDAGEAWIERPRPVLDPNQPIREKRTEQGFIISNRR